jgi:hypothetical protein
MDAVCERGNLWLAYDRVIKNKGAAGVDGIGIAEFKEHLKQHWPTIKAKLLAGDYMPSPVRRVDIPKPQGGVRTLGIPTLTDRLIQQALHQVLSTDLRGGFSESATASDRGGTPIKRSRSQGSTLPKAAGGGRHGLGEILRPGQSRPADVEKLSTKIDDGRGFASSAGIWKRA